MAKTKGVLERLGFDSVNVNELAFVFWNDAEISTNTWGNVGSEFEAAQVFSVGFVDRLPESETDDIVIAGDLDIGDGENQRKIRIPVGCIKKIKRLKIPK